MKAITFLCLLTLMGCATGKDLMPKCRHTALIAAATFSEHYDIRIAYFLGNNINPAHCQAQAKIDGEWVWLQVYPATIYAGIKDSTMPVAYYVNIDQALNWSKSKAHKNKQLK